MAGQLAVVIDMGADAPSALSRAGALPGSAAVLLISHLHPDHVSGLPDFLWGEATSGRQQPLEIAGPSGNEAFPGTPEFLARLFDERGAFPDLAGLHNGAPFAIRVRTVDVLRRAPQRVLEYAGIVVSAMAVPHGATPTLAYRLDAPDFTVVFAGDQTGTNPEFSGFASGADLLILHAVINDRARDSHLAGVVGVPGQLALVARASRAKHVVLGHLMAQPGACADTSPWSLADIDRVLRDVRKQYGGAVTLASDLARIKVP